MIGTIKKILLLVYRIPNKFIMRKFVPSMKVANFGKRVWQMFAQRSSDIHNSGSFMMTH